MILYGGFLFLCFVFVSGIAGGVKYKFQPRMIKLCYY